MLKAARRKVLWVSVVDNRLPSKKKVVSVLLSPSFLALYLQHIDWKELGFSLLQHSFGSKRVQVMLEAFNLQCLCSHHVHIIHTSWNLSTWLCKRLYYFLLTTLTLHLPFFTFRCIHSRDVTAFYINIKQTQLPLIIQTVEGIDSKNNY